MGDRRRGHVSQVSSVEASETTACYDLIAPTYANDWFERRLSRQMARFNALLPSAATVLDAGCGHGRDTAWMRELGHRVVGLDRSEGMLREALVRTGPGVVLGDLLALPFGDDTFDGVWMCAVLLHVPRAQAIDALRDARRVLRGRGHLFVTVQAGAGDEWREHDLGRRYIARYSEEELVGLHEQAGFEVLHHGSDVDAGRGVGWVNLFARATSPR